MKIIKTKKMYANICLSILMLIILPVQGAKILMVFNSVSKSHYILGHALGNGLAEKGHQVTMISPFESKNNHPNYHELFLQEVSAASKRTIFGNMYENRNISFIPMIKKIQSDGLFMANLTLYDLQVLKLVHSNEEFDAVITEIFLNECLYGLANHFNAIPIHLSTVGASLWTDILMGNPNNPAYNLNQLLPFSAPMKFHERLINTVFSISFIPMFWLGLGDQQNAYESYFKPLHKGPKNEFPHLLDLTFNFSLMLINDHHVISEPRASVPNAINVGGLHIKESQLPKHLKDVLDTAVDGAIYFSLGSNVKSSELTEFTRNAILSTFSKIKQKVIWKFEDTNLPNKPDNVVIGKWMPQQAILAHPNIKAFVTHGGLLSILESIYFGVPVVGFPVIGDQQMNMLRAENMGFGITLKLDNITQETLTETLNRILYDQKYQQRAKELQAIFRDEPQTPLEKAVTSVEFVIRHKGARFLRSPALDLQWYQILLIDVIAVLMLIIIIPMYIMYFIIKNMFKGCKQLLGESRGKIKHD